MTTYYEIHRLDPFEGIEERRRPVNSKFSPDSFL